MLISSAYELVASNVDKTTQEVENLSKIVMTPAQIEMMIKAEAPDGIKTETGFTFDEKAPTLPSRGLPNKHYYYFASTKSLAN